MSNTLSVGDLIVFNSDSDLRYDQHDVGIVISTEDEWTSVCWFSNNEVIRYDDSKQSNYILDNPQIFMVLS